MKSEPWNRSSVNWSLGSNVAVTYFNKMKKKFRIKLYWKQTFSVSTAELSNHRRVRRVWHLALYENALPTPTMNSRQGDGSSPLVA